MEPPKIQIKELDINLINPTVKNMNTSKGGSKIVVIGKPGTGKTTLITSLLYEKRDIFPCGVAMSGTEDSNGYYQKIFGDLFVHPELSLDDLERFKKRQKIAVKYLKNPWSILLLDDVTEDPKLLYTKFFQSLFKNGRHWKCLFILSLQYCMDIKPSIRNAIDGTFILRESILRNRKSLWENFASIIPNFNKFCDILDQITSDYTALYIHNSSKSNNIEDCVFWYKAKKVPKDFKVGHKSLIKSWNEDRYNKEYSDPIF